MTTFKEYVSESKYDGTLEKTKRSIQLAIKKFCPNNFEYMRKNNVGLWRRNGTDEDFSILMQREKKRMSLTSKSGLINFVESSPLWSEFPNRKLSASCTIRANRIKVPGGAVSLVIPFDSVTSFGVTPGDFNYIAPGGVVVQSGNAFSIKKFLNDLQGALEWWGRKRDFDNLKVDQLDEDSFFEDPKVVYEVGDDLLEEWRRKGTRIKNNMRDAYNCPIYNFPEFEKALDAFPKASMKEICDGMFGPKNFHAEVCHNFSDIPFKDKKFEDGEVWYSGKAILIRAQQEDDVETALARREL